MYSVWNIFSCSDWIWWACSVVLGNLFGLP